MSNRILLKTLVGMFLSFMLGTQVFAEDTVQAAWREIKLEFPFVSRSTGYYCHRVNKKVEHVLQLAGAHPETKVKVRGCRFEQPTGHLYFSVETAIPVLAPPKRKSDETPPETPLETNPWGSAFAATWKQVNLAREVDADLRPGDCELMRALEAHVFSQMTVTVDKRPEVCRSDATKRHMQDFIITALAPVTTER